MVRPSEDRAAKPAVEEEIPQKVVFDTRDTQQPQVPVQEQTEPQAVKAPSGAQVVHFRSPNAVDQGLLKGTTYRTVVPGEVGVTSQTVETPHFAMKPTTVHTTVTEGSPTDRVIIQPHVEVTRVPVPVPVPVNVPVRDMVIPVPVPVEHVTLPVPVPVPVIHVDRVHPTKQVQPPIVPVPVPVPVVQPTPVVFHKPIVFHMPAPAPAPPTGVEMIDGTAQWFLWLGFALLLLPLLYFLFLAAREQAHRHGRRKFYFTSSLVNGIACVAYLIMASGGGWANSGGRQFFYMRYIDWFFTTPLMLYELCAIGMTSGGTMVRMAVVDMIMIFMGAIGAYCMGDDETVWGILLFIGGLLAFLPIIYTLLVGITDPTSPSGEMLAKHSAAAALYQIVMKLTVATWMGYPLVWILAEGSAVISPSLEVIFYLLLDIAAKSVFGLLICNSEEGLEEVIESEYFSETQPLYSEPKQPDVEAAAESVYEVNEPPAEPVPEIPQPEPEPKKAGCCR